MSIRRQVIRPPFEPISECIGDKPVATTFDVIIIGSGYGGAIAAARWAAARPNARICLLERGSEFRPGMFPANFTQAQDQVQVHTDGESQSSLGKPDALFDLRVNEDVSALVGCGLGGTSLINANVALEVNRSIFNKRRGDSGIAEWPGVFVEDPQLLDPYYELSRKKLGSQPYPAQKSAPFQEVTAAKSGDDSQICGQHPQLNKFEALERSAIALGTHASSAPINVTMTEQTNWAGIPQPACNGCGDCCSGCNVGAKNTTLMNFLPFAVKRGVKIYCSATVDYVQQYTATEKDGCHRWRVCVSKTPDQFGQESQQWMLSANTVIIAAGTLGTGAIMQRSAHREGGLALSGQLGKRFSGNGDVLGFGYNTDWRQTEDQSAERNDSRRPVHAVGLGENRIDESASPGPCITGVIDLRQSEDVSDGLVIQEGVIPGALASLLPAGFLMAATQRENFMRYGLNQAKLRLGDVKLLSEAVESSVAGLSDWSYKGPISRTQTYLLMSVDESCGSLKLSEDKQYVTIDWPGAGRGRNFERANETLAYAVDAVRGQYMPFPLWDKAFGNKVVSVHPLGGCSMGDDIGTGVVNDRCEVFNPAGGVYEGLYICDGSVLPGSIGVNPLLTICAITERACDHMLGMDSRESDPYQTESSEFSAAVIADKKTSDQLPLGWARSLAPTTHMLTLHDRLRRRLLPVLIDTRTMPWMKVPGITLTAILFGIESYLSKRRRLTGKLVESRSERFFWVLAMKSITFLLSTYREAFSPGFFFSETMRGFVSRPKCKIDSSEGLIASPYEICYREGQAEGASLTLALSMHAQRIQETIDAMRRGEGCEMQILPGDNVAGSVDYPAFVICPLLNESRLDVLGGRFCFLNSDPESVETWLMEYEIHLEGYYIYGRKRLKCDEGSHWWTDLTLLEVEIYHWDGRDPDPRRAEQIFAVGQARLTMQDIVRQASTLSAPPGDTALQGRSVRWLLNLLNNWSGDAVDRWLSRFYMQSLIAEMSSVVFRSYGGMLASMSNLAHQDLVQLREANGFPRRLAAPRAGKPIVVDTADGYQIRLTRYSSHSTFDESSGSFPIILAPGMGVNASSFATPTVEENLVEYLTWGNSHGEGTRPNCDVWLFDYRASADSGSSAREFCVDDIARYDWIAAIDTVLAISGAPQVQIIAHCVGSMSLLMGLLRSWIPKAKVASIISSQLTLHPVTNWLNKAKVDGDTAKTLSELKAVREAGGIIDMNPLVPASSTDSTQRGESSEQDFDRAIDLVCYNIPAPPHEQCNHPVCNRIFAVYGPSYLHANLNHNTHLMMGEWFRAINLKPFEQLSKMIELGYVVDRHGENTFFVEGETVFPVPAGAVQRIAVPGLDMPITFVAGALNLEFLPQTSQRTYDWLCEQNPEHNCAENPENRFYRRHVFERYGHMDLFIGKHANKDVFPYLWLEIERHRRLLIERESAGAGFPKRQAQAIVSA